MSRKSEFLELIEMHKGILFKVSRIYCDNPTDQEELQQEIVLRLWESFGSFQGRSQFSSWMYRVSVNTAITSFKKSKKTNEVSLDRADEFSAPDQKDDDDDEGMLQQFYRAIPSLNRIEKAVVFLAIEGCSHKEIAAHLGISEGNARVKLSRIKTKLKTIIRRRNDGL